MSHPRNDEVLVLQHFRSEPPAVYEEILVERGYRIHRVELDENEPLPDSTDFAAVIVMGGPMGALDDDVHPWLADERRYITRAVAANVPYWGVCLGAQLLAAASGAKIYTGDTPEVGTYSVTLAPAASSDPVFSGLPEEFSVFQWHSDSFELPEGAVRLASSELYDNQVFATGSAYGVQFHVEVGEELAAEWASLPSYQHALESLYGAGATERVMARLTETVEGNRRIATDIFTAWLDRFVEPHRN